MHVSIYYFISVDYLDDGTPTRSASDAVEHAKEKAIHELVADGGIDYINENQPAKRIIHYRGAHDRELLKDVGDNHAINFNAVPEKGYVPVDEGYIVELRAHVKPGDDYFPEL